MTIAFVAQAVIDESQVLRKQCNREVPVLVGTNLLTSRHPFAAAAEQGRSQIDEGAQKIRKQINGACA